MKKYILLFMFLFTYAGAIAMDEGPGGPCDFCDPDAPADDVDVPIDGGVGLLILAGAVYGVKKIRQLKP